MKADVFSLNGQSEKKIDLPAQFSEPVRQDIISRAVISEQTRAYQPKGSYKWAGLETSAQYVGRKEAYGSIKNKGISRLPREIMPNGRFGKVRRIPFAVGGRRAHPPQTAKILIERINHKEYAKAIRSAIAATADREWVVERGHVVRRELPIIVNDAAEELKKAKDVLLMLNALDLNGDLERAKNGRKKRCGGRKGGTRTPRSVLIVVGEDKGILKAARNIAGVDVAEVSKLTASLLAPGTHPGRLTVWSENALKKMNW